VDCQTVAKSQVFRIGHSIFLYDACGEVAGTFIYHPGGNRVSGAILLLGKAAARYALSAEICVIAHPG
jgi:hypothetical protein